jgi:hypothetical protein
MATEQHLPCHVSTSISDTCYVHMCDSQTESLLHEAEGYSVRQKAIGERQKAAGHRGKAQRSRP